MKCVCSFWFSAVARGNCWTLQFSLRLTMFCLSPGLYAAGLCSHADGRVGRRHSVQLVRELCYYVESVGLCLQDFWKLAFRKMDFWISISCHFMWQKNEMYQQVVRCSIKCRNACPLQVYNCKKIILEIHYLISLTYVFFNPQQSNLVSTYNHNSIILNVIHIAYLQWRYMRGFNEMTVAEPLRPALVHNKTGRNTANVQQ